MTVLEQAYQDGVKQAMREKLASRTGRFLAEVVAGKHPGALDRLLNVGSSGADRVMKNFRVGLSTGASRNLSSTAGSDLVSEIRSLMQRRAPMEPFARTAVRDMPLSKLTVQEELLRAGADPGLMTLSHSEVPLPPLAERLRRFKIFHRADSIASRAL